MESNQTADVRVKLLETKVEAHEKRITQHGHEIDDIARIVAEIRANDRHRDETMSRIEGKVDTLVMKPSDSWERLKQTVLAVIATAIVTFLLSRIGING